MKAFFHRLHLGGGAKDKDRDAVNVPREKFPPLPSWPPQEPPRPASTATAPSVASFKPLPELVPTQLSSQLSTRPLPPIETSPSPSHPDHLSNASISSPKPGPVSLQTEETSQESSGTTSESAGRSSRKTNGSVSISTAADVQKKVAFLSPPQTPVDYERALPDAPATLASTPTPVPLKTTVSRFQAVYGKEPRGSVSTGGSSSKVDVTTTGKTSVKAPSARTSSPYIQRPIEGSSQSLRSGTPYSQMSNNTSGSRILAAQSWSEVTEDDLVSNLGMRERTRQEVLFEIISSEERYVQELVKMKDTFIDPLLHPYSMTAASAASTPNLDYDYYRSESPFESSDDLPPIAARFMSPTPSMNPPQSSTSPRPRDAPVIDGDSLETDEDDEAADRAGTLYDTSRRPGTSSDHPRSPYRITATRSGGRASGVSVPFPSRSHMSLPPAPRNPLSTSTHSLGRQSMLVERERERDRDRKYSQGQGDSPQKGMLKKFRRSQTTTEVVLGNTIAPHQLPEDLRICLEVIDSGVFDGHKRLSEALKKRYDDQFPLVRSLADVFVSNSDIFHGYATYVLHLERALEQVDAALSNHSTKKPKKQDVGEWQKVCKFLQKLEENASDKGETGLAITLSKPFQRLLKYPLLFQNLLFHTDPSTFEYESTLQMVAEVENIVRSIEDEKIQKEERDKTRDVFARIEGLDKVRQVALPKPSRVLLEERACTLGLGPVNLSPKPASPPPVNNGKAIRGKSSFKRLSDVLSSNGIGGKKDLWFVIFNDVVLQCQRTGTTSLPLVASTNSRTNSLPELQGKAKYATTGRRNSATKPRNMYKFIKIETWDIGNVLQPREGVVTMEDMAKSRAQAMSSQPRIVPLPDDDENNDDNDSDDSDKKSKMSFSYWGADKVTVQKPVLKGRTSVNPRRGGGVASYGRESSANAKFGTRLVSDGPSHAPRPPSSRRTTTTTPTPRRQPPSDEGPNYARATITRPAWDTSTRSPIPNPATKRSRNPSQASPATRTPIASPKNPIASPAPSEDSGVGMYRQMLAKDPSFNDTS
ncbi:hypothetical protein CVT25_012582 [Psilocybe cyanescens]|uniref:DH domain-containing protein n=1 Tax=Psilocybe cyanescens TaxID=93625 RepID=A0A409X7V1_PSICY|nr:hypothetical protein CVT25_012582 [Psilocybe cyanescens]